MIGIKEGIIKKVLNGRSLEMILGFRQQLEERGGGRRWIITLTRHKQNHNYHLELGNIQYPPEMFYIK